MDKLDGMSMNLISDNIIKLKGLFPAAVTEDKIDFDMLRSILGDEVDTNKEKYQFTWPGKSEAIKLAQSPSSATLRPCKEQSKNWGSTENLYIEGDNLEVLKQLQKTYYGKIKMIYIDPPYNTGNDFVYKDDFSNSIQQYKEQTQQLQKSNPETSGRYHSNWLNMMYPRLILARNLLSDDGVIFISIDNNEMDNLKKIGDELFGSNNFIAHIIHKNNSMKNQSKFIGITSEFVLVYCKSIDTLKNNTTKEWRIRKKGTSEVKATFERLKNNGLNIEEIRQEIMEMYSRPKYSHLGRWNKVDENGVFTDKDLSRANGYKDFTIMNPETGKECLIPSRGWAKTREDLLELQAKNMIWYGDDTTPPREKSYLSDEPDSVFDNYIYIDTSVDKKMLDKLLGVDVFDYPKPLEMIETFIELCTSDEDIVLDFFSGSATTGHAVMHYNYKNNSSRKFILVQLPEIVDEDSPAHKAGYNNICDIGEERLRRAGEQIKTNWGAEHKQKSLQNHDMAEFSTDIGFKVFKLDSTNINPWDNTKKYDEQTIFDTATVFKLNRSNEDILYEIMLKYGIFDQPVSEFDINGKKMFRVGHRHMIVCLGDEVDDKDIKEICKLEPKVVVFKEDGFKDDNAKINAEYNLKNAGVEDVRCI